MSSFQSSILLVIFIISKCSQITCDWIEIPILPTSSTAEINTQNSFPIIINRKGLAAIYSTSLKSNSQIRPTKIPSGTSLKSSSSNPIKYEDLQHIIGPGFEDELEKFYEKHKHEMDKENTNRKHIAASSSSIGSKIFLPHRDDNDSDGNTADPWSIYDLPQHVLQNKPLPSSQSPSSPPPPSPLPSKNFKSPFHDTHNPYEQNVKHSNRNRFWNRQTSVATPNKDYALSPQHTNHSFNGLPNDELIFQSNILFNKDRNRYGLTESSTKWTLSDDLLTTDFVTTLPSYSTTTVSTISEHSLPIFVQDKIQRPPSIVTNKTAKVKASVVKIVKLQAKPVKPVGIMDIFKYFKDIQSTLITNTAKNIKDKIKMLESFKDKLLVNIEKRINILWPINPKIIRNKRSHHDSGTSMDFPSSEAALLTISFLTFAVFLIKLVLQVINTIKSKHYSYNGFDTVTGTTGAMTTVSIIKRNRNARRASLSDLNLNFALNSLKNDGQ